MPLYWIPALFIFSAHADDVATVALKKGAEVCALYLRNMPAEMPGRKASGTSRARSGSRTPGSGGGVALFRTRQQGRLRGDALWSRRRAGQRRSSGSRDCRAQARAGSCHRTPRPGRRRGGGSRRTLERRSIPEEYEQHRVSVTALPGGSYFPRRRRPPLPDGPQRRVPEGFRSAIMDWGA